MYMGKMGTMGRPTTFPVTNSTAPAVREPHSQTMMAIPSGMAGINVTLSHMRRFVDQYKTDPRIREVALHVTAGLPQKDFDGEMKRLHSFVKSTIRYTRDINGVETVQSPVKTLEYRAGDCDDKAVLLATLLESVGFKTRFYAVGFRPDNVEHVLLECELFGNWIALETTEPVAAGWTPPNPIERVYK